MKSIAPRPAFRLARFGRVSFRVALSAIGLASMGVTAGAQDAMPTAPSGDLFGGLRGTLDAAPGAPALSGFTPPPGPGGVGAVAGKPAPPGKLRFQLQGLRNQAIPARYPVPLPELVPYPRAVHRPVGFAADPRPNTTVAALPVVFRRVIKPDDAPFAPIGYQVGSVRLFPYVEQSLGYDSNPDQISSGIKASPYSRTEGGLAIQSLWSVHDLRGTLHGGYTDFFRNKNANRPDATGIVNFTVDVSRDTKIDTEARFNINTQRPGSPELNVDVVGRPLIEAFGGTFGVTQGFGRFSVGLHGLVDRTTYDDGVLANGHPVDLAYQNVTDYGAKLRVGYDVRPGLQPFIEVGYDTRVHDLTVDPSGYRRDSDGVGARIGSTFEFFPRLTGTASLGYAARAYDDPRLLNLTGPVADASLIWAVTPLTTLTLNGATSFNETTVVGASGIESRSVGVLLSHALFRYLVLSGAVLYQNNEYIGAPITENTLTESVKAEYHLSRSIVLTGTLSHQRLSSTVIGSDYTQNIALLGVRLQH